MNKVVLMKRGELMVEDGLTPAEFRLLETVVEELITEYHILEAPIRVEQILQYPLDGMGASLQVSKMSTGFIQINKPFAPRMALARWLARQLIKSDWGIARQLDQVLTGEIRIKVFARILLMPRQMIMALQKESRTVVTLVNYFQVPPEEAKQRLEEIARYS